METSLRQRKLKSGWDNACWFTLTLQQVKTLQMIGENQSILHNWTISAATCLVLAYDPDTHSADAVSNRTTWKQRMTMTRLLRVAGFLGAALFALIPGVFRLIYLGKLVRGFV